MRNLFQRINTLFGDWYERLFGVGGELHPREVLRRLVSAAEEHRIEALDGELYVPNRYKLEIALRNPEEQEAYLTFLQPQDLADALWQELREEGYRLRGGIVCEVVAQEAPPGTAPQQALRVTAKFDPSIPLPTVSPPPADDLTNVASHYTVPTTDVSMNGAAWAVLKAEDGQELLRLTSRPVIIGRSRGAGCDLVLEEDRQISRRHARIEWDASTSNFLVYDLQSTNGLFVNDTRVDNRVLRSGDRIRLGRTVLVFEQVVEPASPRDAQATEAMSARPPARLILRPDTLQEESIPLPDEVLIGRALTADIPLEEPDVSMRHAVVRWNGSAWQVEDLGSASGTLVNGLPIPPRKSVSLHSGDTIHIGSVALRIDIEDTL